MTRRFLLRATCLRSEIELNALLVDVQMVDISSEGVTDGRTFIRENGAIKTGI